MTKRKEHKESWFRSILDIVVIVLIAFAAKTALAEPFYVPSASMEPTLLIGDELLATKFPYGYGTASLPSFISLPASKHILGDLPERGDVVVFRWPGDASQIWVKRVIGLPGDRVAVHNGVVSINGVEAKLTPDGTGSAKLGDGEPVNAMRYTETLPGGREHAIFKLMAQAPLDNMDEITVPPNHVFVMGDNRDDSADSRVPLRAGGVGMLPVNNLVGRVEALVASWDLTMKSKPIWQWPDGLRFARFFTAVR